MTPASNTRECFSEFIDQKVVGVLFDALPRLRADIAKGSKALVFEDGRALVIAGNGTYYIAATTDVKQAVCRKQTELEHIKSELEGALKLAGELP